MPIRDRAAQFAPFAALTGYDEAVRETARHTESQKENGEYEIDRLNRRLGLLKERLKMAPVVSVTFFQPDGKKEGGSYVTVTGAVRQIDEYKRALVMWDHRIIPLQTVLQVEGELWDDDE